MTPDPRPLKTKADMARRNRKPKIGKGMPSAVLLSIAIHATLFFLAGMLVVFTVVKKKEVEFEPPRAVERPKMKLKKPKVKVKKTSKPKPTTRIVTKIDRASMPDIQLPEMSGMGEGLGEGIGGFDMLPDLEETTVFGGGQSIGNDFEGIYYDFKRDRSGRTTPLAYEHDVFIDKVSRFHKRGWKLSDFSRYYRAPKKIYTTCFMLGPVMSYEAPKAFGEEDVRGWNWLIYYQGSLVYPEDITFRFWGVGDAFLMIRIDGKLVLNGNFHDNSGAYLNQIANEWSSPSADDCKYWYGVNKARVSDWIELKAGETHKMEVLIGESVGGWSQAMLTVQVEGVEYPTGPQGNPILPMFKTAEPSRALQDAILCTLVPGEVSITNGPVFCDYHLSPTTNRAEEVEVASAECTEPMSKMHVWGLSSGETMEAEYVAMIGGKAVLKTAMGRIRKIPLEKLSPADREYMELIDPPEFKIDYVKLASSQLGRYTRSPYENSRGDRPVPRCIDYTFGAEAKQTGTGSYNHELTLEYIAVGKEIHGDKYVLLDRQSSSFVPGKENGRSHRFTGEAMELLEVDFIRDAESGRGVRPAGYLITLTDKRGCIIQHKTSNAWLWENKDRLEKLPVGAYMDKACIRAYPTGRKVWKY